MATHNERSYVEMDPQVHRLLKIYASLSGRTIKELTSTAAWLTYDLEKLEGYYETPQNDATIAGKAYHPIRGKVDLNPAATASPKPQPHR